MKLVNQIGRIGKEHVTELSEHQESRAMSLHQDSVVFDLHMHSFVLPEDPSDYEQWIKAGRYELGYEGIKHAGLTAYLDFGGMGHSWRMDVTLRDLGLRWHDMSRNDDKVLKAARAADVLRAREEGKTAVFFGIENSELINDDLDAVDMLYGLGLRALGLCYNKRNLVGDGRVERIDGGLSNFGLKVIERMNRNGMIVDLSHASERTTLDAAEASEAPIIISHTGARGVFNTGRMATDEELTAVASKGGLIGIHSGVNVLSDTKRQSVDVIVDHIDYCVKLVGIDHVCIGSDNYFGDKNAMHQYTIGAHSGDGMQSYLSFNAPYMEGFENPSEWKNVTRALVQRGYGDEEIRKLIGGNAFRLIQQVIG